LANPLQVQPNIETSASNKVEHSTTKTQSTELIQRFRLRINTTTCTENLKLFFEELNQTRVEPNEEDDGNESDEIDYVGVSSVEEEHQYDFDGLIGALRGSWKKTAITSCEQRLENYLLTLKTSFDQANSSSTKQISVESLIQTFNSTEGNEQTIEWIDRDSPKESDGNPVSISGTASGDGRTVEWELTKLTPGDVQVGSEERNTSGESQAGSRNETVASETGDQSRDEGGGWNRTQDQSSDGFGADVLTEGWVPNGSSSRSEDGTLPEELGDEQSADIQTEQREDTDGSQSSSGNRNQTDKTGANTRTFDRTKEWVKVEGPQTKWVNEAFAGNAGRVEKTIVQTEERVEVDGSQSGSGNRNPDSGTGDSKVIGHGWVVGPQSSGEKDETQKDEGNYEKTTVRTEEEVQGGQGTSADLTLPGKAGEHDNLHNTGDDDTTVPYDSSTGGEEPIGQPDSFGKVDKGTNTSDISTAEITSTENEQQSEVQSADETEKSRGILNTLSTTQPPDAGNNTEENWATSSDQGELKNSSEQLTTESLITTDDFSLWGVANQSLPNDRGEKAVVPPSLAAEPSADETGTVNVEERGDGSPNGGNEANAEVTDEVSEVSEGENTTKTSLLQQQTASSVETDVTNVDNDADKSANTQTSVAVDGQTNLDGNGEDGGLVVTKDIADNGNKTVNADGDGVQLTPEKDSDPQKEQVTSVLDSDDPTDIKGQEKGNDTTEKNGNDVLHWGTQQNYSEASRWILFRDEPVGETYPSTLPGKNVTTDQKESLEDQGIVKVEDGKQQQNNGSLGGESDVFWIQHEGGQNSILDTQNTAVGDSEQKTKGSSEETETAAPVLEYEQGQNTTETPEQETTIVPSDELPSSQKVESNIPFMLNAGKEHNSTEEEDMQLEEAAEPTTDQQPLSSLEKEESSVTEAEQDQEGQNGNSNAEENKTTKTDGPQTISSSKEDDVTADDQTEEGHNITQNVEDEAAVESGQDQPLSSSEGEESNATEEDNPEEPPSTSLQAEGGVKVTDQQQPLKSSKGEESNITRSISKAEDEASAKKSAEQPLSTPEANVTDVENPTEEQNRTLEAGEEAATETSEQQRLSSSEGEESNVTEVDHPEEGKSTTQEAGQEAAVGTDKLQPESSSKRKESNGTVEDHQEMGQSSTPRAEEEAAAETDQAGGNSNLDVEDAAAPTTDKQPLSGSEVDESNVSEGENAEEQNGDPTAEEEVVTNNGEQQPSSSEEDKEVKSAVDQPEEAQNTTKADEDAAKETGEPQPLSSSEGEESSITVEEGQSTTPAAGDEAAAETSEQQPLSSSVGEILIATLTDHPEEQNSTLREEEEVKTQASEQQSLNSSEGEKSNVTEAEHAEQGQSTPPKAGEEAEAGTGEQPPSTSENEEFNASMVDHPEEGKSNTTEAGEEVTAQNGEQQPPSSWEGEALNVTMPEHAEEEENSTPKTPEEIAAEPGEQQPSSSSEDTVSNFTAVDHLQEGQGSTPQAGEEEWVETHKHEPPNISEIDEYIVTEVYHSEEGQRSTPGTDEETAVDTGTPPSGFEGDDLSVVALATKPTASPGEKQPTDGSRGTESMVNGTEEENHTDDLQLIGEEVVTEGNDNLIGSSLESSRPVSVEARDVLIGDCHACSLALHLATASESEQQPTTGPEVGNSTLDSEDVSPPVGGGYEPEEENGDIKQLENGSGNNGNMSSEQENKTWHYGEARVIEGQHTTTIWRSEEQRNKTAGTPGVDEDSESSDPVKEGPSSDIPSADVESLNDQGMGDRVEQHNNGSNTPKIVSFEGAESSKSSGANKETSNVTISLMKTGELTNNQTESKVPESNNKEATASGPRTKINVQTFKGVNGAQRIETDVVIMPLGGEERNSSVETSIAITIKENGRTRNSTRLGVERQGLRTIKINQVIEEVGFSGGK